MKFILLTLLFCCSYLVSFAQNSLNSDAENTIKNVIYEKQLLDYSKVNLHLLVPQANPKKTKIFGRILQGGGLILMSNSLFLGFILYRFGSSGKDIFYPLAGAFVVGGVIFYTGTRMSINGNKKIRENLMGIKNTSLFMQNQRVNLASPNTAPMLGFSLAF